MSKQASDRNLRLPSSATLRVASMAQNPLHPFSSSSSHLNPSTSIRGSHLPSLEIGQSSSLEHSRLGLWPFSNYQNSLSTVPSFQNYTNNFARTLFHSNLSGQNYTGWSAPVHYQQAYGYGHQFYTAPPLNSPSWPQPLPLPGPPKFYIDPVRPTMLPSIPPSMRIMNFSASRQQTILFEELFQECRQKPIDVVAIDDEVDDEEENVRLELMLGGRAAKRPKVDLTLTIKPPTNGSPDNSRPHV